MNTPADNIARDLRTFLTTAGILTLLGLVFVYSASSVYALEELGSSHYFFARHLFSLLLAVAGFVLFYLLPSRFWQRHAGLFFGGALTLSALSLLPQVNSAAHGAARWLYIGRYGIQPSILLPLFSCIYLGSFIAIHREEGWSFWRGYVPLLVMFFFTTVLLLQQADVGTALIVLKTVFILCFIGQCRSIYLATTGIGISSVLASFMWYGPYKMQEWLSFVHPWRDPGTQGEQTRQSLVAIGSGGWWGTGVAYSKQKLFYLPMQHTDFIFSIIAEEVGFIGSFLIISAYIVFAAYGLRLVLRLRNPFAAYTTLGFVSCIMLQVLLNMLVATGMVPMNGLGLPFVSFGGSSLLVLGCMIGFITNAVHEQTHLI